MRTNTGSVGELLYVEYDNVDFKKIKKNLHAYRTYKKFL